MPDGTLVSDYTQWIVVKDLTNNVLMIADYKNRMNYLTIDLNAVFADGKPMAKLVNDLPYPKAVAGPEALRAGTPDATAGRRQHQFRAQAADRGGAERQAAAVERGEFDHDRQAEPRAGLGLVEPASAPRDLLALGRRQAAAVVVDDDAQSTAAGRRRRAPADLDGDPRLRPFAGIVDEIADHLLEVLPLAAELRVLAAHRPSIARSLSRLIFSMVRASASTTGDTSVTRADHREPRRDARALEMARDLVAHDVGLLAHLLRQRIVGARGGLVHDHRERRLQRMREIADMGARAFDDFAVGVEQRIGFARQRRDLDREIAFEPLGLPGADRRELLRDALERRQAEPHLEQRW